MSHTPAPVATANLMRTVGALINFHELKLTDGIVRMILPGANRDGAIR